MNENWSSVSKQYLANSSRSLRLESMSETSDRPADTRAHNSVTSHSIRLRQCVHMYKHVLVRVYNTSCSLYIILKWCQVVVRLKAVVCTDLREAYKSSGKSTLMVTLSDQLLGAK